MTDQNAAPEAVAERIARMMMMRPTSLGPSGNILVPLESDQIAQWCVESAETMGQAAGTIAALTDRNRALMEALDRYGRHRNDSDGMCAVLVHSDNSCTCGLTTALHPTQPKEPNGG